MRITACVFAVLLLLGYLATGVTLVRPGELAVVRRFGAIVPDKSEPGLLLTLPWGMDRVDRVAVDKRRTIRVGWIEGTAEEQKTPLPAGQLLTGDHNLVNAEAEIHYRVVDREVDDFVLHGSQAEALIARAAEAALAQWLAGRRIDDILRLGRSELPGWLVAEIERRIAPYQLGVRIEQADVKLSPPSEVNPYFQAVSNEHVRIKTQVDLATREADAKLSEAAAERSRIEHDAKAYAAEQHAAAQADAETFQKKLDQYRRLSKDNPNFINDLWLDAVTRLYADLRRTGRIDLLDHYIGSDGLNVTQFPLPPRKK